MAFRAMESWFGGFVRSASARLERASAALDLLVARGLEPERRTRTEAELLGLAFARFLTGALDRGELQLILERARPEAFWAALEAFTNNISGEEWRVLSRRLLGLREVERERLRLSHPSPWRRALAARHVGLLDARGVRRPLREAMQRGPALVTFSCALALARMRDRGAMRWLLEHPDATGRRSRRQLAGLLKRFGPGAVPELRAALQGWSPDAPIHLAAIDALGLWRDRSSLAPIAAVLGGGGLEARVAAARALGMIGSPRALAALVAALDDPEWPVRAQAAHALGAIPAPSNLAPLAARVRDVSWWVRRHSAYALAHHGPAGRETLLALARQGEDAFAAEMAHEVLQLMEWERESRGGFARVV